MIKIFPAIDLLAGRVARLTQGDFDRSTLYGEDPAATAAGFLQAGAKNLHLVDLDGARDGRPVNMRVIRQICGLDGLFIEVGGGIRDQGRIEEYLAMGADRVILGTVAANNPEFVRDMVKKHGDAIAVGIDARAGKVAISGWKDTTALDGLAFAGRMAEMGVSAVIYTDIAKDGAMSGTNLSVYRRLREECPTMRVVASGGVCSAADILALKGLGVDGAIVGKALYEGRLTLEEALAAGEDRAE